MAIHQYKTNVHWNLLLALDMDAGLISRYVEFAPDNYETYSIELARLLMSAGSEVDVVSKLACLHINPNSKAENIEEYRAELVSGRPNLSSYEIQIRRFGFSLKPWSNWAGGKHPDWWRAYNAVKHERNNEYRQANLKNSLNALAGLYVMLLYAFPDEAVNGELAPSPTLLSVEEEATDGYSFDPAGELVHYKL